MHGAQPSCFTQDGSGNNNTQACVFLINSGQSNNTSQDQESAESLRLARAAIPVASAPCVGDLISGYPCRRSQRGRSYPLSVAQENYAGRDMYRVQDELYEWKMKDASSSSSSSSSSLLRRAERGTLSRKFRYLNAVRRYVNLLPTTASTDSTPCRKGSPEKPSPCWQFGRGIWRQFRGSKSVTRCQIPASRRRLLISRCPH